MEQGWGLGWAIRRESDAASMGTGNFGSLVPAGAFGHSQATGTAAWADPGTGTVFILLTNGRMPPSRNVIRHCCNAIATAI